MKSTTTRKLTGMVAGAAALTAVSAAAVAAIVMPKTDASVLVLDQSIKSGALNIDYVYMPRNGYVVIYGADAAGKPTGEPLAHVPLQAGDHRNITAKLTAPPAAGSRLWASLYEDSDGKPGFTKGSDVSLWSDGKLPLENTFTVR